MNNPLLRFGAPPDAVAWASLGLAATGLAFAYAKFRPAPKPAVVVTGLALTAAMLSAGYLAYYLRGGPRIIDATSYWLEARTFAERSFAFDVPEPSGSFRGRFLVPTPDGRLAAIFPPGYPALLALGFVAGVPLAIGPLLGAGLVVVTYALGKRLLGREDIAQMAAALSVLSVALRYHTADTMSHGLAALLFAAALVACWPAPGSLPIRVTLRATVGGLCAGWLVATRPLTGAICVLVASSVLVVRKPRDAAAFCVGVLPGLALLAAYEHSVTGHVFGSSQLRYYALADGPPGCFGLGFGQKIGCLYEHGEFVRARLPDGYGPLAALLVTLRRLQHHALDIANFELLALAVPIGAVRAWQQPAARVLAFAIIGVMVGYGFFYFDATYPGGGARLFADVLPLEHVLAAAALVELRLARFAPSLALAGFACHASFSHRALAEREGGRPMFEPKLLSAAGIEHGLVFVGTDHGFNLGYLPGSRDAIGSTVVARAHDDAHDRVLWERLGRPLAHRYRYDPFADVARPSLELMSFAPVDALRFEAEAEWPVLDVRGGFAYPDFAGGCVSGGRVLAIRRTGSAPASLSIAVVPLEAGPHTVTAIFHRSGSEPLTMELGIAEARRLEQHVPNAEDCWRVSIELVALVGGENPMTFSLLSGQNLDVDAIEVLPSSPVPLSKRR